MKSNIIFALLVGMIISTAYAGETLKTRIQWDHNKARTLALKHLEEEIDVTLFQGIDPNFVENQALQQNPDANTKVVHRQVTFFSGGDYSVAYDGENIVNYYRPNGDLEKVSVCSTPFGESFDYANYPRKCAEYSYPQGRIISVSLDVSPEESFVFLPNGQLKNHWVGNTGYSDKGVALWQRR